MNLASLMKTHFNLFVFIFYIKNRMASGGGSGGKGNAGDDSGAWHPDSWRSKPAKQQVEYEDKEALAAALAQLKELPPLVSPLEVTNLRKQLAEVAAGKRFLLQGGDCAER